jgi:hypothetical protein
MQDLEQSNIIVVSDGSFKDTIGTAAWILESKFGNGRATGF